MTQASPRPLYALRMMAQGHYLIAKFAMPDFTVEATYNLIAKGTGYACDCPASARVVKYKPCKHQRMLPFMLGACNTDRFYEPESRSWCQPLAPDLAAAVAGEAQPLVVDGNLRQVTEKEVYGEGSDEPIDVVEVDANGSIPTPTVPPKEFFDQVKKVVAQAAEPPKLRRRV